MSSGSDCADYPFYFEILKIIVPSVLVVLGWAVVYNLQRKAAAAQECRKEFRAALDRAHDDVRTLRQDCISYFVAGETKADLPVGIRVLFEDLRRRSMGVANRLLDAGEREKVLDILTYLGQNATGGDFETRNRKNLSFYDKQMQAIINHSASLLRELEAGFEKKYPRT